MSCMHRMPWVLSFSGMPRVVTEYRFCDGMTPAFPRCPVDGFARRLADADQQFPERP